MNRIKLFFKQSAVPCRTAFFCSFFFAVFTLLGSWLRGGSTVSHELPLLLCKLIFSFILLFFLILGLLWLRAHSFFYRKITVSGILRSHGRLLVFLLFLLFYLPAFLALYPGIFGYDGPTEMMQFFHLHGNHMTAQHTLAHIYLLAGCFNTGRLLLHSANLGLSLYGILQAVILSAVFTYTIDWLYRHGAGKFLLLFSFLFLAVNPVIQLMLFNTTKDTLFGGFFLLTVLELAEIGQTLAQKSDCSLNAFHWKRFLLFASLMCLFRKQGYFLLFFVLLIACFLYGKKNLRLLMLLASGALIGYFLMNPLVTLTGTAQADKREMLSVPMQQVACVWLADHETHTLLTDQERKDIEALILPENLSQCTLVTADPVKSGFQTPVLMADKAKYLSLYLHLSLRYPQIYLRSYCGLLSGYFDLFSPLPARYLMEENTYADFHVLGITRQSLFPAYAAYLHFAASDLTGIAAILTGAALPVWIMLLTLITGIAERRKEIMLPLLLMFGQWGIMLLSPVALLRYAFPLIITIPVLLFLWIHSACNDTCQMRG